MEITKREILISIAIVCVMFVCGLLIHQNIRTAVTNKNKEYETALQIEDSETFKYAMKTNAGNAFVYGDFAAVDPVVNKEIEGEWLCVQKVKEKYTKHHRVVTEKKGKQTTTRIEYYWTWDKVGTETWHANEISFLGVVFPYNLINITNLKYIKLERHGDVRYKYYAFPAKCNGTIYTKLADETIAASYLYEEMTTEDLFKSKHVNAVFPIVGFWILWIIITIGLIFGFYSLENKWLE